ncbi:hypothetical protein B0H15DRAFT_806997 [Mycena belliarum]|uniref:BZIP domain-containing protein n=1 Tax=Mycena belliarum TaxID=1033014 RepID=A0AAD6XE77_9AGAR|nr:hypothetical protein B0H15DRAFT_806997 [Mycena belliae]
MALGPVAGWRRGVGPSKGANEHVVALAAEHMYCISAIRHNSAPRKKTGGCVGCWWSWPEQCLHAHRAQRGSPEMSRRVFPKLLPSRASNFTRPTNILCQEIGDGMHLQSSVYPLVTGLVAAPTPTQWQEPQLRACLIPSSWILTRPHIAEEQHLSALYEAGVSEEGETRVAATRLSARGLPPTHSECSLRRELNATTSNHWLETPVGIVYIGAAFAVFCSNVCQEDLWPLKHEHGCIDSLSQVWPKNPVQEVLRDHKPPLLFGNRVAHSRHGLKGAYAPHTTCLQAEGRSSNWDGALIMSSNQAQSGVWSFTSISLAMAGRPCGDDKERHLRRLASYRKYRRSNIELPRKKGRERMAKLRAKQTEAQREKNREAQRRYRERSQGTSSGSTEECGGWERDQASTEGTAVLV